MNKEIDPRYLNISKAFVNTDNLSKEEFLHQVFETAFELIPEAQKGSFYEVENGYFMPVMSRGYDIEILSQLKFSEKDIFIGYDVKSSQEVEVNQVHVTQRDDKFSSSEIEIFKALGTYENFTSLYTPIKYHGKMIGLLSLENFDSQIFSEESETVLKIYGQSISNIYAIRLNQEKEKKRYLETINAMMSIIEVKDPYTIGHAKRVMDLSTQLAKYMKLNSKDIEQIKIAAILHDIGKIGIPDDILNKDSGLTAMEYEVVKTHPEIGLKILNEISDFNDVSELMYHHHERYDGKGYPNGFKGDEIRFGAQIIQITDAYDAMTSERAYRKPFDKDKALSIIESERGQQFHPIITDCFIEMMHNHK